MHPAWKKIYATTREDILAARSFVRDPSNVQEAAVFRGKIYTLQQNLDEIEYYRRGTREWEVWMNQSLNKESGAAEKLSESKRWNSVYSKPLIGELCENLGNALNSAIYL